MCVYVYVFIYTVIYLSLSLSIPFLLPWSLGVLSEATGCLYAITVEDDLQPYCGSHTNITTKYVYLTCSLPPLLHTPHSGP